MTIATIVTIESIVAIVTIESIAAIKKLTPNH